jgi:serine/threonine protein kinase/TolB-like protein/cytochrome c-type biogenesis protein CcmH/NrfG
VTGQTISHYRILNKLGAGGMGDVFLAEDSRLGRKLALKLLPAQFTQDADRVKRFTQEARAASALNHPNILTIYEIGQHEGAHFIATEYVEGTTLRQLLPGGSMSLSDALDLTIQAASALQAAHQANIVHRDIKPENIMRRPDGYVKLLDFGLAKLTQQESDTRDLDDEAVTQSLLQTQPGLVMGTIAYMSPEQARGQRVDARTDLFSLGVVLYEMVCGKRPFQGQTHSDIIASVLREEPQRISQHLPNAPLELEQVMQKLLQKDREARYGTAAELIADLKRIKTRLDAAGESVAANILPASGTAQMSYETNVTPAASFATNVTPAAMTNQQTAAAVKPVISRKALAVALGSVAVLVATLFGLFFYNARQRTVDAVAVLPFYSADNKLLPLSEGLTEEVINAVSNLPEISVIARNSVVKYKARETDPVTVGEELGVQAVLTGEVSQLGPDALVQVELTDAKSRRRIWGKSFTRKLDALYALQGDIVQGLAQKLNLKLDEQTNAVIAQQETKNGEAYRLYLEGRYYFNQGTPEAMHKADELFEKAFGLDNTFINAAAGCAACHAYGADQEAPDKVMPKARTVAQVALKGDPKSADAHLTLARVALRYDWDFKEAERLFKRAIELEPKNASAHQRYAEFLGLMGRHKEANAAIYQARKLDPRSLPINSDIGTLSYFAADYPHAFEHFQQALKLDKDFANAHTGLGLTYEQQNRAAEAVNEFLEARKLLREDAAYVTALQDAFAKQGIKGFWQQELAHLTSEAKERYVPATSFAALHARLGDVEAAFKALQQGLSEKDGGLVDLNVTPVFAALRQDARFAELLQKVGLKN